MPRYFFHLQHVRLLPDKEGSKHSDIDAAKVHAVKLLAEALAGDPEAFWNADIYRMTVAKGDGLALFTLETFATMAPAAGGRAPLPRC